MTLESDSTFYFIHPDFIFFIIYQHMFSLLFSLIQVQTCIALSYIFFFYFFFGGYEMGTKQSLTLKITGLPPKPDMEDKKLSIS